MTTMLPIKLLSQAALDELASGIETNAERYAGGTFDDSAKGNGWAIETTIATYDPSFPSRLLPSSGSNAEINNSKVVYSAFQGITPALAREERLWARLCHVECLEFSRARWIKGDESLRDDVKRHFFAPSLPHARDDNAIGRLWWNGHIASLAFPGDIDRGLKALLSRANVRLQVVDRADTAFRRPLIQGIARLLEQDDWIHSTDDAISFFMYEVNKRSGGIIFEALPIRAIDEHLLTCLSHAKARRATR
jgi:hypothetical protein